MEIKQKQRKNVKSDWVYFQNTGEHLNGKLVLTTTISINEFKEYAY